MGQELGSQDLLSGSLESDSGLCHFPEAQCPICKKGLIVPTSMGQGIGVIEVMVVNQHV